MHVHSNALYRHVLRKPFTDVYVQLQAAWVSAARGPGFTVVCAFGHRTAVHPWTVQIATQPSS